jgi:putative aminopeptidase FrvX
MELLLEIQSIPGPSGDEGRIADSVEAQCRRVSGTTVTRCGDLILAVRGRPRVAVFAHLDTIGFTQGYQRDLIPIGGPHVEGDEAIREVASGAEARVKIRQRDDRPQWRVSGKAGAPGSRWVYAAPLVVKKNKIIGPYLDNRAGVWNGLRTLQRCSDVAVLFTPGEEHSGRGALIGARLIYQELGIQRALISDITWHTGGIKNGKGPAISLRDRYVPRQRFLDEVIAAAEASRVPFQREVESGGASDGAAVERSTFPIDWVFIGAPQKHSHTPKEECLVSDLEGMSDLYAHLIPALSSRA